MAKPWWASRGRPVRRPYTPASGPDTTMAASDATALGRKALLRKYGARGLTQMSVEARRELLEAAYRALEKGES